MVGFAQPADGHPGGTDNLGCHRDSATGIRHCHNDGETDTLEMEAAAFMGFHVAFGESRTEGGPFSSRFSGGIGFLSDTSFVASFGYEFFWGQLTGFYFDGRGAVFANGDGNDVAYFSSAGLRVDQIVGTPISIKLGGFFSLATRDSHPAGLLVEAGWVLR
jgi:hypothetical protein